MSERFTSALGRHLKQADTATPADVQALAKAIVASDLQIETVEIPREPNEGALVLRGKLLKPSEDVFPRWLKEFRQHHITPLLQHDTDSITGDGVALRLLSGVMPQTEQDPRINLLLFVLTLISTLWAGAVYERGEYIAIGGPEGEVMSRLFEQLLPQNLIIGWPFALTIMTILAAHEFGHYFAARFHKVAVTLPYFIPLPPPIGLFGTLGAVIRMKEPIPDKRKLFDIGIAGPLAGLVFAVPLLFVGLSTSELITDALQPGGTLEGNSILYYAAKWIVFGEPLPNFDLNRDVFMNQVTFAAWTGLLVTALNLLPVGQLDGGHTVFALFGNRARPINMATIIGMAILGIAGIPPLQEMLPFLKSVGFMGWFLWIFLIFYVIGLYHPPALDDVTKLDPKRKMLGYLIVLIFILIFVAAPMREI